MLPKPELDSEAIQVGSDVVRYEDGVLVIYSPHDMPEWVVREFRRPAIFFKGHKFYLRAKERAAYPFRWKYFLWSWPEEGHDVVPYVVEYGEAYVRERGQESKEQFYKETGRLVLLPLFPVLGFLWSGVKEKLEPLGFNSHSITSISVHLELGLAVVVGIFVGYLGFWSVSNVIILIALVMDTVLRYDAVLREKPRQPGFFEWFIR